MSPLEILKMLRMPPTKKAVLGELVGLPKGVLEHDMYTARLSAQPTHKLMGQPIAYRYQTSLPLMAEDVYHYDINSGLQIPDVIKELINAEQIDGSEELLKAAYKQSKLRVAPLSVLTPENTFLSRHDPWVEGGSAKLLKGKSMIYPNEYEGGWLTGGEQLDIPRRLSVKDILSDPAIRQAHNFSVATPENSPLYRATMDLRGGQFSAAPKLNTTRVGRTLERSPEELRAMAEAEDRAMEAAQEQWLRDHPGH